MDMKDSGFARQVVWSFVLVDAAVLLIVLVLVAVGMASFEIIHGVRGAALGCVLGGLAAFVIPSVGDRFVRHVGGAIGSGVGGFFAVAAAEGHAPGTAKWAFFAVLLGGGLGLAAGSLFALLALAVRALGGQA